MSELNGRCGGGNNEKPKKRSTLRDLRRIYDELHRLTADRVDLANSKAIHSIAISLHHLVDVASCILEEFQLFNDIIERKMK
jgi:predicted nucleotidyltransferase